jgi:hypothetical protein
MFLLENKDNLASHMVPLGPDSIVTAYKGFEVVPDPTAPGAFFSVLASGSVTVGGNGSDDVTLGAAVKSSFRSITDPIANYDVADDDYAVEIVSDTINTITLPAASGKGGKNYVISRRSNNNNLVVQAYPGDNIDSATTIELKRMYDHIEIMSNDIDTWYII